MDERSIDVGDERALGYRESGDPNGQPVINCHGGLVCGLDAAPFHDAALELGARLELCAGEGHFLGYRHQADVLRDLVD
jgi:hypothetical protein